jgi:hypothetical protein
MDDFYIGYLPQAPKRLARNTRNVIILLIALNIATALAVITAQAPFAEASFDYAREQTFTGVVRSTKLPTVVLGNGTAVALVAPGKHGYIFPKDADVGHEIKFKGTLIQRDGSTMVEVSSPLEVLGTSAVNGPSNESSVTVEGEIVDSKCFLGVMNPGQGKVHRACAARCIHGGVPPAVVTSTGSLYYLVDSADRPLLAEQMSLNAGRRVRIEGKLRNHAGLRSIAVTSMQ